MNIIRKILLTVGILAVLSGLVYGGFYYGFDYGWSRGYRWGTGIHINSGEELEFQQKHDQALEDSRVLTEKLYEITVLCEEKYQRSLIGDNDKVLEIIGKISAIEKQEEEIAGRYTDEYMGRK